jgi:hypothetical protein
MRLHKKKTPTAGINSHRGNRSAKQVRNSRWPGVSPASSNGNFTQAHLEVIQKVNADDATWFEQNPRRVFRIRPLVPGEMGSLSPGAAFVLVVWVADGTRLRAPFDAKLSAPPNTDEAGAIFAELLIDSAVLALLRPFRRRVLH